MRLTLSVLLAGCALLAGCTQSSTPSASIPPASPNPSHAVLLQRAHLDPCPTSNGAPAHNGLPDVTLPCLGRGPAVRLAALRGKPVFLHVWGSWCGPCQRETPYVQQAYQRLEQRVQFLGVDDEDSVDSALDFAAHVSPPMRFPSVVDEDKKVLLALNGPVAVPQTVLVAADGHIVHVSADPYRSTAAVLADVAKYLGVHA